MRKGAIVTVTAFLIAFVGGSMALSKELSKETTLLKGLLDELDQAIKSADQRMIAHPKFLKELRALERKYRAKLRTVYLFDDFSDGDYTKDPQWIVDAGQFVVTDSLRLASHISPPSSAKGETQAEEKEQGGALTVGGILREVLKTQEGQKAKETPTTPSPTYKKAMIHTLARISPDFEVDIQMVSLSGQGAMEVVLLGGDPPVPYYKMVYRSNPSAQRPIKIVRQKGSRKYVIDEAFSYPNLDDGRPHRIQWIRDARGQMKVLVDGKEVLRTVELYYRSPFKGLALANRGGSYEWDEVKVFKAQPVQGG